MEAISEFIAGIHPALIVLICIIIFVGFIAQWMLYEKCNIPGYYCIIPVWNVIAFIRIVGRPWFHSLFIMIPPPVIAGLLFLDPYSSITIIPTAVLGIAWLLLMARIYIEVCQAFGRTSMADYTMVLLLNGLYILNLGLSYKVEYKGPVFGKHKKDKGVNTQLA